MRSMLYLLVIFPVLLAGCNPAQSQLAAFDSMYRRGQTQQASEYAGTKLSESDQPRGNDLLWTLQAAAAKRAAGDYAGSNALFDRAEEHIRYFDLQTDIGAAPASVLVNDNIVPYKHQIYDGIMVNVYKAMNFISLEKFDLARVEFNRALERQSRAKIAWQKRVKELRKEINSQDPNSNTARSVNNPEIQKLIDNRYPGLRDFEAYPDFVNPFATYLAGVFFTASGDYSRAADLLKESAAMVGDNRYVTDDFVRMEKFLSGEIPDLGSNVWVFFENGLGPRKTEWRLDLPLFVATDKVDYFGVALPQLEYRQRAWSAIEVIAGNDRGTTEIVADMDRIVHTEFEKDFSAILTRTIISATGKAVAQYALKQNSQSGGLASLAMAAYSAATTAADLRIWTALPKDFQVVRIDMPEDRIITVNTKDGIKLADITIGQGQNAMVFIKILHRDSKPLYDVITFK